MQSIITDFESGSLSDAYYYLVETGRRTKAPLITDIFNVLFDAYIQSRNLNDNTQEALLHAIYSRNAT